MYSFVSTNPARLARFWAELMRLPVADGATDDFVMLDFDHEFGLTWLFERVDQAPAAVAPISLDLGTESGTGWAELAERAVSLGAERVADREVDGVRWIELRDPDGNRFRVFGPRPEVRESTTL
ncbi:hypothetical protein GCM10028864_08400 [Microlunatus parietis]